MNLNRYRWGALLILLISAGIRIAGISHISPPGISHDEVANWQIARQILDGHHAVYFTQAYGHEAGFHYIQAGFVYLLGNNLLALRLPAIFAGTLLVALILPFTRQLFDRRTAFLAMALAGGLFWGAFFSRQGLRAISLPLLAGLSAYCWQRARLARPSPHLHYLFFSALLAGLSLYTYMAARAVPIFYLLFVLYLGLFHHAQFRARWRAFLLFFGLMGLISLPLARFLWQTPNAEVRIGEVDQPLQALRDGDIQPVLQNGVKIAGMFGWQGDPLWRHNVANMAVFDPISGILFYAGILISLRRWRDKRYAFLLLWLVTSIIPSLVTIDAPSSIRAINGLFVVTIFPALTINFIHNVSRLSTDKPQLSTRGKDKYKQIFINGLIGGLLLWNMGRTGGQLLQTWQNNNEVQFVWQAGLADSARWLDSQPSVKHAGIIGWSPDTMDAPTMQLILQREDIRLLHIGAERETAQTLIMPAIDTPFPLLRPTVLPIESALESLLQRWGVLPEQVGRFTRYELQMPANFQPKQPQRANFGDELMLLGWEITQTEQRWELISYWQVETPPNQARRLFLHGIDQTGEIITQDDGLSAPTEFWQAGDIILHYHRLDLDDGTPFVVRLGVYDPLTGRRLMVESGADYLILAGEGMPAILPPE